MLEPDEIVTLIRDYDNPAFSYLFDIEMQGLENYICPETDLYSLVMLSQAKERGLDLVFVDREKFFHTSVMGWMPEILDFGPFEGARYVTFDLTPILLEGYEFSLSDYAEGYGYGFVMNTINFVNDIINHYLKDTGRTNFGGWQDENVNTIAELTVYINKILIAPIPKARKTPLWEYLLLLFIYLGVGVYYILKYIFKGIQSIIRFVGFK